MKKLVVLLLATAGFALQARVKDIRRNEQFADALNDKRYALVLFTADEDIEGSKGQSIPAMNKLDLKTVAKAFRSVSDEHRYKRVLNDYVGFYQVLLTSKYAQELILKYKISQVPVAMIFKDGALVSFVQQGKKEEAIRFDPLDKAAFKNFIDDFIGEELEKLEDKIEERKEAERQERIARAQESAAMWNATWGYYDPYWGWGTRWGYRPYRARPAFGIGIVV